MSCCRLWPALHATAFVVALGAWTVALLSPVPQDSAEKVLGGQFALFLFAKTIHVTAYAVLTAVGGTAVLLGRRWWWLMPALVVHGAATEYLQQFVGRGSKVADVGLDALGIAIGGLVAWGIRSLSRPGSAAPSSPA